MVGNRSRWARTSQWVIGAWAIGCAPKNHDSSAASQTSLRAPVNSHAVAAGEQGSVGGAGAVLASPVAPKARPPVDIAATRPATALSNVNLLHMVPARIAVSSAVRNPHDFPEYLVDNHLETAWNSRTGDLVGGWIDFQIPKDAKVRSIELTSGYSRVKGKDDLFLQNHRISRIELIRDGQSLGEFPLDVNQRGLQPIAVAGEGGIYRILVKATVPGTRRDWRELAVSELRVMGDPGKELRPPEERIQVAVGGLENYSPDELRTSGMAIRESDADPLAFATPEALCANFVKSAKAGAAELLSNASGRGIEKLDTPFCHVIAEEHAIAPNPIYSNPTAVLVSDGLWKRKQLVVKVQRGYVLIPVFWQSEDPLDPGCPSIFRTERIEPLRIENGHLVVTETGRRYVEGSKDGKATYLTIQGATWCGEAGGKLTCHSYDPSNVGSLDKFSIAPDGTLHIQ
jgi:hypothetical protein